MTTAATCAVLPIRIQRPVVGGGASMTAPPLLASTTASAVVPVADTNVKIVAKAKAKNVVAPIGTSFGLVSKAPVILSPPLSQQQQQRWRLASSAAMTTKTSSAAVAPKRPRPHQPAAAAHVPIPSPRSQPKGGGAIVAKAEASAASTPSRSGFRRADDGRGGGGEAISDEVPIFLQKTYHMIDTCDTDVAGWSEDGRTFIVKDTSKFETTVVPQFFKHSKFTSFVRQLNFYGFRKIKYSDTLLIDRAMEARTANFWRFRHVSFRRGRKDLLTEIKRHASSSKDSNGNGNSNNSASQPNFVVISPATVRSNPDTVRSNPNTAADNLNSQSSPEDASHLRTEVSQLKQRIAGMAKNIDNLSSMVQKMDIQGEVKKEVKKEVREEVGRELSKELDARNYAATPFAVGSKRKKADPTMTTSIAIKQESQQETNQHSISAPSQNQNIPVADLSMSDTGIGISDVPMSDLPMSDMPDWAVDESSFDNDPSNGLGLLGAPLPDLNLSRGNSLAMSDRSTSGVSDDEFVDNLLETFTDDDFYGAACPCPTQALSRPASPECVPSSSFSAVPPILQARGNPDPVRAPSTTFRSVNGDVSNSPGNANSPDPALLRRISDSLATLPRDLHAAAADRIVDAIDRSRPPAEDKAVATPGPGIYDVAAGNSPDPALVVAALTSVLAQYGVSIECRRAASTSERRGSASAIPVAVPIHA